MSLSGNTIRDFEPTKSTNRSKYSLLFRNEDQLFSIDPATDRRTSDVLFKLNRKKLPEMIKAGKGAIAILKGTKRPEQAIYASDYPSNNLENLPITAKVAKDWDVRQMAWSPDMQSLVVLASKVSSLDQENNSNNSTGGLISVVYETVTIDFKHNKLRLIDRFTFDSLIRWCGTAPRSSDDFVLLRWTSSGIVTIIGKRVLKVTSGGRKTVIALKEQPLVSGAISPNGKRIVYETVNRAWVLSVESGAKARLVKDPVFSTWTFDAEWPGDEPVYGEFPVLPGLSFDVSRIAWISNERAVMFVPDEKKEITRVFELASLGKFRQKKIYGSPVGFGAALGPEDAQAAVSPNGKYIFTGKGVWDVENFTERQLSIDSSNDFMGWIALD